MSNTNFCFEGTTPIVYKKSLGGDIIIESIKDAYENCQNDDIYVCVHTFDEHEHISRVNWIKAKFCHTESIKQVTIYIQPDVVGGLLESDNIIRVTTNHTFPVLTKNGYKDTPAYLLQTGDKLIFERQRKISDIDVPVFDEDGNPDIQWMLEENSEHYIDYRHISKVIVEDIDKDSSVCGIDFYGVVLDSDSPSKYFMICNSVISCSSSVD